MLKAVLSSEVNIKKLATADTTNYANDIAKGNKRQIQSDFLFFAYLAGFNKSVT